MADTFRAVGADPRDEKAVVEKSAVSEFMKNMYELDVRRQSQLFHLRALQYVF